MGPLDGKDVALDLFKYKNEPFIYKIMKTSSILGLYYILNFLEISFTITSFTIFLIASIFYFMIKKNELNKLDDYKLMNKKLFILLNGIIWFLYVQIIFLILVKYDPIWLQFFYQLLPLFDKKWNSILLIISLLISFIICYNHDKHPCSHTIGIFILFKILIKQQKKLENSMDYKKVKIIFQSLLVSCFLSFIFLIIFNKEIQYFYIYFNCIDTFLLLLVSISFGYFWIMEEKIEKDFIKIQILNNKEYINNGIVSFLMILSVWTLNLDHFDYIISTYTFFYLFFYPYIEKQNIKMKNQNICSNVLKKIYCIIKELLQEKDSKRILIFLSINGIFMFIEIMVGLMTNSLGLLSDASHMFCDNGALMIGLMASYIAKWPKNEIFSFGYGKIETLSGFANCIILIVMSFGIIKESIQRFFEPVEISSHHLILTAVIGLIINLIGLLFFHDHSHNHSNCNSLHVHSHGHSHDHSHGHSRGQSSIQIQSNRMKKLESDSIPAITSRQSSDQIKRKSFENNQIIQQEANISESFVDLCDNKKNSNSVNAMNSNLHAVYLHILADTLGSLGVIVSSLLVHYKNWVISDSICSFFLSLLILGSTFPLLKTTLFELLDTLPQEYNKKTVEMVLSEIHRLSILDNTNTNIYYNKYRNMSFKVAIKSYHFWKLAPGQNIGSMNIIVSIFNKEENIEIINFHKYILTSITDIVHSYLDLSELTIQVKLDMMKNPLNNRT